MGRTRPVDKRVLEYFGQPSLPAHRQYLALRKFLLDGATAEDVAAQYGYTVSAVYSIARNFKNKLVELGSEGEDPFFRASQTGPKPVDREGEDAQLVIEYRKRMMSIPDIEILMAGHGRPMSAGLIGSILKEHGFVVRLPKRNGEAKRGILEVSGYAKVIDAPASAAITFTPESRIPTAGAGILCFLPIIRKHGVDQAIEQSAYPGSKKIPRLNAILSFLALKLSSVERFGHDDGWCMDRGLGLFAGLNVLPKTTWYSVYSDKTTRTMNKRFLKALNSIWGKAGLLGDTVNMDFTAIPYWGEAGSFENNWSGKRHKALASIEAALAQDPDTGILCYGDTTIKHETQNGVVLEFLDFYLENVKVDYLVFDSKFTVLGNLSKIDAKGVKFITIQRKSKAIDEKIAAIPREGWKSSRVELDNHRSRVVRYAESETENKRYGHGKLRQIFMKGNHVKHSVIITNEFGLSVEQIIRKYARRWLIENEIQEHVDFFHLNRNSSGIVIKVDFDLTMTILAHNLYRLLAMEIPGFSHMTAKTLFKKFTEAHGEYEVGEDAVDVKLNLKRTTPLLLEALPADSYYYPWIGNKRLTFAAGSHS